MLDAGCWMLDTGCSILDAGYSILDTGLCIVVEKAHLVGLSHGAKVALAYAANSPERIHRLVLCSVCAKNTDLCG